MTRSALLLTVLVALAVVPAPCDAQSRFAVIVSGGQAPDYSATSLQGDTVRLESLRGSVVMLNVWATWCAPCRHELPMLQELHEEFGDRGLRMIGISVDRRAPRTIQAFLRTNKVTYTNVKDTERRLFGTFHFQRAIPQTLLIDQEGTIIGYWLGVMDEARMTSIRATLERLLRSHAPSG